MDANEMAARCRQMRAEPSDEHGERAGIREQCTQMAGMCEGNGQKAEMFKRCQEMAAMFGGQGEAAEERAQSEQEGPQFA